MADGGGGGGRGGGRRAGGKGNGLERGGAVGGGKGIGLEHGGETTGRDETPELARLRRRIDALDKRIVGLLNERAELGREVGREKVAAGRRAVRDAEREREVLLRVTMANSGPIAQADLLAIYRRLIAATRALETRDRAREPRD